jgi:hypothetical protein
MTCRAISNVSRPTIAIASKAETADHMFMVSQRAMRSCFRMVQRKNLAESGRGRSVWLLSLTISPFFPKPEVHGFHTDGVFAKIVKKTLFPSLLSP